MKGYNHLEKLAVENVTHTILAHLEKAQNTRDVLLVKSTGEEKSYEVFTSLDSKIHSLYGFQFMLAGPATYVASILQGDLELGRLPNRVRIAKPNDFSGIYGLFYKD